MLCCGEKENRGRLPVQYFRQLFSAQICEKWELFGQVVGFCVYADEGITVSKNRIICQKVIEFEI